MACRLFGRKPLPETMLTLFNEILRNKLKWNFNENTKFFIHENAPEIIVYEMAAILSRGRWVDRILYHAMTHVKIIK